MKDMINSKIPYFSRVRRFLRVRSALRCESLTTEPITLAPDDVFIEDPNHWVVRITNAFAGRWLLILCWGMFAAHLIYFAFLMLAFWLVPYDVLVAFAEWVAQMVWWFEAIPL